MFDKKALCFYSVFIALLLCIDSNALAQKHVPANSSPWYVGFGWGYDFPSVSSGKTNFIATEPSYPDDRYNLNSIDNSAYFTFDIGKAYFFERKFFSRISVSLSLQYNKLRNKGIINPYGVTCIDTYSYQFNTSSTTVFGNVSFDLVHLNNRMSFYTSAALGGAYNKVFSYSEDSDSQRDNLAFANRGQYEFAYLLGFGLRTKINNYSDIAIGYSYINKGSFNFGSSPIRPDVKGPSYDLSENVIGVQFVGYF